MEQIDSQISAPTGMFVLIDSFVVFVVPEICHRLQLPLSFSCSSRSKRS
jgi:hypothetical protein